MVTEIDKAAESMREQIGNMTKNFNLPDVDISAMIETQRRNIDAMSKAAQLTNEAATEVFHRQLEIFRSASEQVAAMLRDLKLSNEQRRDIATQAFDNASARARELAEMTAKSNREIYELVKQRMTENFDQLRKMFPGTSWGR
jgi:phasin family protein